MFVWDNRVLAAHISSMHHIIGQVFLMTWLICVTKKEGSDYDQKSFNLTSMGTF